MRKRYHLQILERDEGEAGRLPPCQEISVGGLEFRRYTQIASQRAELPDQVYVGAIGLYEPEDVEALRERGKHLVCRWRFQIDAEGVDRLWACRIMDARQKGYEPAEDDEPLLDYLRVTEIAVGLPAGSAVVGGVPEQVAALSAAQADEDAARSDPRDRAARRRAANARRTGDPVGPIEG